MVGDAELLGEEAQPLRDGQAVRLVWVLHGDALRRDASADLRGDYSIRKPPRATTEGSKMPSERSIVTREELFDLFWRSPLRDVARQLHLAPASLRRVCRQHRVPVPGIAHWREKWKGARASDRSCRPAEGRADRAAPSPARSGRSPSRDVPGRFAGRDGVAQAMRSTCPTSSARCIPCSANIVGVIEPLSRTESHGYRAVTHSEGTL
jgi:hypothetical protein